MCWCATHSQSNWWWRDFFQIVRCRERHKKGLKDNYGRLIDFLPKFENLFQLVWFSWFFKASLVFRFAFWCGHPGCALVQPHTCACIMCILSSFVINWQCRRIDHNGTHKPVSVLPPGTPEYGGISPLPFQKRGNVGGGTFSWQCHRQFMVDQDWLETNLLQLFSHPEKSEWISAISGTIFEVNVVDEQKQA